MEHTKGKITPIEAARGIRRIFASQIPTTWDELRERHVYHSDLTAYQAAKMIEEQSRCNFETAAEAVSEIIPELFANYWEKLSQ